MSSRKSVSVAEQGASVKSRLLLVWIAFLVIVAIMIGVLRLKAPTSVLQNFEPTPGYIPIAVSVPRHLIETGALLVGNVAILCHGNTRFAANLVVRALVCGPGTTDCIAIVNASAQQATAIGSAFEQADPTLEAGETCKASANATMEVDQDGTPAERQGDASMDPDS